jgi:hypothetical protein
MGLASATRASKRWFAMLAISISAVARSWVGELCMRAQPESRMCWRSGLSRTHTMSGKDEPVAVRRRQLTERRLVLLAEMGQARCALVDE